MISGRSSNSMATTIIPSINNLKDYNHDKVIAILKQGVVQPLKVTIYIKKRRLTSGDYPANALDGEHLLNAIYTYDRVYNDPNDTGDAFEAMINDLMEYGKITNKYVAISVANWLIKTYFSRPQRIEHEFNMILNKPNITFDEICSQCYEIYKTEQLPPLPVEFSNYEALVSNYCNESDIITLELKLGDGEEQLGEYALRKLPFDKDFNGGKLRKHILPFILSLQIPINNQEELETLPHVACAIAASGMGKTSLMTRCMTTIPGLLIIGSVTCPGDNGETTDLSVGQLQRKLNSITQQGEKYAIVRQGIHIVLISHLIHIIKAINNATKNPLILEPFEGNLNLYIGHVQCNGNTSRISNTFYKIFKWAYYDINIIRNLTLGLIEKVCELTKSQRFIFCVDQADVFEKYFGKYKSVDGTDRGGLSVIASEIAILMNKIPCKTNVIYAGTKFSLDTAYVLHSATSGTNVQYLMNFDYFNLDEFISFLKLHVKLPQQEEDNFRQHYSDRFPIRRRLAGLVVEQMPIYLRNVLEQSFDGAVRIMEDGIRNSIKHYSTTFVGSKEIENEYSQLFRNVLFKYYIHYEYSNLLGHEFIVKGKKLANKVLHSGLTAPKVFKSNKSNGDGEYVFEARDYLGYTVAKYILGINCDYFNWKYGNLSPIEKCKLFIAEYATNCEELDTIVALSILECEGKTISETVFSNDLTTPIENHQFKNLRIMIPSTFKQYCLVNEWITTDDKRDGEELYWEYLTDKTRGWSHIDGIIFRPSSECHSDILLFSKSESDDEKSIFISTKCTYSKDRKRAMDEGFKSTLPTLFYLDSYNSISIRGKTLDGVRDNINTRAKSLKTNEETEWWNYLRDGVLKVLNESVICLQVIVNINEMETTQFTPPPGKYFKDSICIDRKENGKQFFGAIVNDELNDFIKNIMKKKQSKKRKQRKSKQMAKREEINEDEDSESTTTTTTTRPSTTKSKKRNLVGKHTAKEDEFSSEDCEGDKSTTKKRKQEKVEKKNQPSRSANRS